MTGSVLYHEGNRQLQDAFDSRRISDRLEEKLCRYAFTADDKAFVESAIYFFLATADAQGRPDCSFKGGPAGFVRVTGASKLSFPGYDGNGMFKSLGNLTVNPSVGLLFIDMHGRPHRLRVNGIARVLRHDPLLAETIGAQLIVRVEAHAIFPNYPRYVPRLQLLSESDDAPRPGCDPVEPAWKTFPDFQDAVHPRQPTARARPAAGSHRLALAHPGPGLSTQVVPNGRVTGHELRGVGRSYSRAIGNGRMLCWNRAPLAGKIREKQVRGAYRSLVAGDHSLVQ